jgi:HAD superfamily hydrolase (TIGR01484 family)
MSGLVPLADCSTDQLAAIDFVLTDIDDTLTDEGRLPAIAYSAMERLSLAGIIVVPITGRPAGWCDLIARQWPVAGVVGENGAFYFRYDPSTRRMIRRYAKDAATRATDRIRLERLREAILTAIPEAGLSADQAYREADLAIDFAEDVGPLPRAIVLDIVGMFEAAGATAKVSSIHVNGWFGTYDKLSMTKHFFREVYGLDLDHQQTKQRIAFTGDSPNDQPMFGFLPLSVGVANVLAFADLLEAPPAFVTSAKGGSGFAEFADALLAAKI